MNILIKNGRLIDPANGVDGQHNLYLADGRVAAVGAAPAGFTADRELDAAGAVVCPGLVDLSARLPNLDSELQAAVAGGVTTLVCPPDTKPVLDEPGLVERLVRLSKAQGQARVRPLGALTQGLEGQSLAAMAGLTGAGCIAMSQASSPVTDFQALLRAMQYAATYGYAVWLQPEDYTLSRDGVAHDGEVSARLGLAGIPVAAETVAVATLVELARTTGVRLHLMRLSSAAGVRLVAAARAQGLPVTCDVDVHHLHLTEEDIGYFDPLARFDPPLRTQGDREALVQAVADGTIQAICSDHYPRSAEDKLLPFDEAEPGAIGLELLLPLTLAWAQDAGVALPQALARITSDAAAVAGLHAGNLSVGAVADVTVFDPEVVWTVGADTLRSRGRNTPFLGRELRGRVRSTLVGGQVVYQA